MWRRPALEKLLPKRCIPAAPHDKPIHEEHPMKLRNTYPLISALAIGAAGLLMSMPSEAATWQFSQDGYAGDAQVSGFFAGEDGDHDGWILGYEVSNFSFTFSGNQDVGAFTSSFANGGGFSNLAYRLGSTTFDPFPYGGLVVVGEFGEGDDWTVVRYASFSADWNAGDEPGVFMDFFSDAALTRSNQSLRVSAVAAVPEPQTWALMAAGLALLPLLRRRRQG
jgi:MYXO-CTERM domain-containing protein